MTTPNQGTTPTLGSSAPVPSQDTLPENWQDLIRSTLPTEIQERWIKSAPITPGFFRLLIAAYEEGKKPGNETRFAISSPAGVQWRDTLVEAQKVREELQTTYGKKVCLAGMPHSPPLYSFRAVGSQTRISTGKYTGQRGAHAAVIVSPLNSRGEFLLEFSAHSSVFPLGLNKTGLFDTGCSNTTIAREHVPADAEGLLQLIVMNTPTGLATFDWLQDKISIILKVDGVELGAVTVPDVSFTEQTLIGMNVIGNFEWRIGKNNDGVVELRGVDENVDADMN